MGKALQFFDGSQWNDAIDKTIAFLNGEPIVADEIISVNIENGRVRYDRLRCSTSLLFVNPTR